MTKHNFCLISTYPTVLLKPIEEFGFELQQRLDQNIAGAKLEVKYLEYAMPTDAKLVFTLSGEDIDSS